MISYAADDKYGTLWGTMSPSCPNVVPFSLDSEPRHLEYASGSGIFLLPGEPPCSYWVALRPSFLGSANRQFDNELRLFVFVALSINAGNENESLAQIISLPSD